VEWSLEALGTQWKFSVPTATEHLPKTITDYIESFEAQYSRFRDNSILSKLNRSGVLSEPPAELVAMLQTSMRLHETSNGMFNPTVGGALENLGYGEGGGNIATALTDVLDISTERITLEQGYRLDLGGIGKGWLIDLLAVLLTSTGHSHWIINGGGDIRCNLAEPASFLLEHPTQPGLSLGTVALQRGALATSSPRLRHWRHKDTVHHHLISPHTQASATSTITMATCIADTATIADTAATILYLLDMPLAQTWQHPDGALNRVLCDDTGNFWSDAPQFVPHT
jgi:FAD:protein FMN transferase